MHWPTAVFFPSLALAACVVACSSSSSPASPEGPGNDAGASDGTAATSDGPAEAAADGPVYPAFQASPPAVQYLGGPVLKSAHVVPVFFASDPNQAAATDFVGKYLASQEWNDATAQYGILSAVAMPAVVAPALPFGTASPAQFEAWFTSQLDGTQPAWGAVDDATLKSTVFLFFVPPGPLYPAGSDPNNPDVVCQQVGGWHSHTTPPSAGQDAGAIEAGAADAGTLPGVPVVYGIVGECSSTPGWPLTISDLASHELVEAFTDPFWDTAPANTALDTPDVYWSAVLGGPELGDMCQATQSDWFTPSTLGYDIQRTWSRKAAAAGDDPCQPLPAGTGPYFNSVPETPDVFFDPSFGVFVHGVTVPAGKSRTIDVHLFSTGPTSDWPVAAYSVEELAAPTFAFDHATGNNGDVLHLMITAPSAPQVIPGETIPFMIVSGSPARQTFWVDEVMVE